MSKFIDKVDSTIRYICSDKKFRFLLLLPIVIAIIGTSFMSTATTHIAEAQLQEKKIEIVNETNMLANGIDADPQWSATTHETTMIASVEYMDQQYQVYAGAYKIIDGEYKLITNRFYETSPFEPFDYPEFRELIESEETHESGYITINYAPENQDYRDLYVYYRHMPIGDIQGEQYLVVTGISYLSIVSPVGLWISIGVFVIIYIFSIISIIPILVIIRMIPIFGLNKQHSSD